jgi:threonine dehydrogenase-like Zn-dependent dehydrogenase
MHALFFDGRQLRLDENYPDPEPAPGESLVQVLLAGICATDLEIVRGYAGFDQALALLRPEGTLVLKSTYADPDAINLSPVVVDEIRVVGSRCGPFKPALAALAGGAVDPLPLIDAVYPLTEGLAAMQHAARRGALKVLMQP